MVKINIQKKDLWLLSAIMVFLAGVVYVIAYGGNQPSVHGHSAGEVESVSFGSWTNKDSANNALTFNITYKATSDGFVIFRNNIAATVPATIGYTDSSNPPTTERAYASEHSMDAVHSAMMPVKKDEYWRITTNAQPQYIYWLPTGNGQCVKQ